MQPIYFIVISVVIAACIGGITNHLAIKMLFHPRNKHYIAGKRIPFTPGLIPKRKEEIARSLGKVVGDYLVTSEGLSVLLKKPEFRLRLETKLNDWIMEWSAKEETLEQTALRFWTADQVESFLTRLVNGAHEATAYGISWLWDRQEQASLTLEEMIPDWTEQRKEQFVTWVVNYLLEEIKRELRSPSGDKLLRQLTGQVMEQAGGVLGALAGMFMDEEKMLSKVKVIIHQKLESPRVKSLISDFLYKKVSEWEKKKFSEVIETMADQDGKSWLIEKSTEILKWDKWLIRAGQWQWNEILGEKQRTWLLAKAPVITGSLLNLAASNIDRMVKAIELPKLVEEQVKHFPVDRLEHIILSVSGKEFKAITWLGALLGGTIGLFQAIMLLWYM